MTKQFWAAFSIAALSTAAVLGGFGWLLGKLSTPAPPERFVSSTFEFDLPKGWRCAQEGTETVCRIGKEPYSAICILTMKYRGATDSFDAYVEHLSQPKQTHDAQGNLLQSEVMHVERKQISGYTWVSAQHYQSEVPRYFTDYYATLTSHIAVLVTFSVHRDHVSEHQGAFSTMISSLKVHQSKPL